MPECVDCTPSRCPNGKCRATNRCIDQFVLPLDDDRQDDISSETFVIENPDGSISLDAHAGMTREELKARCEYLCTALGKWQRIAMSVSMYGRDALWPEAREKLDQLIAAYED